MVVATDGGVCLDHLAYSQRSLSILAGEELVKRKHWRCYYRHDVTVYQSISASGRGSICALPGAGVKVSKFFNRVSGFDGRDFVCSLCFTNGHDEADRGCPLWTNNNNSDNNREFSVFDNV